MFRLAPAALALAATTLATQPSPNIDWTQVDEETLRHFQALLRFDTSDPPGREKEAADYLKQALEAEGIPVQLFALEDHRPNEDGAKGFGAHSDQERILEAELYRCVRFHYDVVVELARAR